MIFYHNQLMKNSRELRLYLVSNPVAFTRFEDHEAALHIQLHELVERAIEQQEDPVALIEDYLQVSYTGGDRSEDLAAFLANTPQMRHAMHTLQEHWGQLDDTLPDDSLLFGSATTREEAVQSFSEITLRSYLEALSTVYND
jgi:hypothetical protein